MPTSHSPYWLPYYENQHTRTIGTSGSVTFSWAPRNPPNDLRARAARRIIRFLNRYAW